MPVSDFSYKQLLHDSVHPMINVLVHIRILTMFTGIFRVKRGGLRYYCLFPHCRFQCRCRSRGCRRRHCHSQKLSLPPSSFLSDELSTLPSFSKVLRKSRTRSRTHLRVGRSLFFFYQINSLFYRLLSPQVLCSLSVR